MRVRDLGVGGVHARLAGAGLGLDLGAAVVCIRTDVGELAALISQLYAHFETLEAPGIFDVTVDLVVERSAFRLIRPRVELWLDGEREFEPFPRDTPLPLLEWGVNFGLATRLYCYLLLHAGVVAKGDQAVLLPAMPGSGKSTLAAVLSRRGYRLLSDEFGVVRLEDRLILPLLRPIALKNASIDVLRSVDPAAVIGPRYPKTRKGTVAHLAPSENDVLASSRPARPALVIFPQFIAGAGLDLRLLEPARAFSRLAVNSFNYDVLGPDGFDALCDLVDGAASYTLSYGDLDAAVDAIDRLMSSAANVD